MEPVKQAQKKYGSHAMVVAIVAGFIFILAGHRPIKEKKQKQDKRKNKKNFEIETFKAFAVLCR